MALSPDNFVVLLVLNVRLRMETWHFLPTLESSGLAEMLYVSYCIFNLSRNVPVCVVADCFLFIAYVSN